jgi:hypothetical protein
MEALAVFELVQENAGDAAHDEAGAPFLELRVEIHAVRAAPGAFHFAEKRPAAGVAVGFVREVDFRKAGGTEVKQGAFLDQPAAADTPAREQDIEAGAAGGPQAWGKECAQGGHAAKRF